MGVEHLIQYDCFLIGSALDLAGLRMPDEQQITLAAEFLAFIFRTGDKLASMTSTTVPGVM